MAITIADYAARFRFVATAAQTVFTVPAEFFANADVKVYLNGTLKTITTHYTVAGAGVQGGGTVTFVTPCTLSDDVLILIDLAIERTTNFPVAGVFDIDALNAQLGKLVKISQRLETDLVRRALRLGVTDYPETMSDLPARVTRASKIFAWDSDGNPAVSSSFPTFLSGSGVPAIGTGSVYDMYINTATGDLYGPKTALGWGSIIANIKGPAGAAGVGDVVGPASSVNLRVAVFSGTTGKLLADGGALLSALATLASPTFTGTPLAPTAAPGTNTTQLATTGFVKAAIDVVLGGVAAAFDTLSEIATELALKATLASPTFTGTPAAPTAAAHTNTTQLSTTAFAKKEAASKAQNAQTGTTYGAVAGDAGKVVTLSNAGAITVTISSATHAAEDFIDFIQKGAGQVTFVGSGVTLNSRGGALKLNGQYAGCSIWFESATVAYIVGDMTT